MRLFGGGPQIKWGVFYFAIGVFDALRHCRHFMFACGKTCPAQELSCVKAEAARSALNPNTVNIREDKSNVSTVKHDK